MVRRRTKTFVATLAILTLVFSSVFSGAVTAQSGAPAEEDAPRVLEQAAFPGDYVCSNYYTNRLRFVFSPSCGANEMLIQISTSLPFDYCYSIYTGIITDDRVGDVCAGSDEIYVEIDGLSSFFVCLNFYTGQMYHLYSVSAGCPAGRSLVGFIDLRGDISKYACVEENLNHNECDVIPPAPTQNEIRHLEQVRPTPFINSTFRLEFRGDQTPVISASTAADMSAPEIEALLEALPSIGPGNVSVTALDPGELWTTAADIFATPEDESTPIRVEFTGTLGAQDITDPILIVNPISVSGGTEHTVIDGSAGPSPGLNNVMPGGMVQVFNATAASDPNNPATYGAVIASGPVDAAGLFEALDLIEGFYVVCATGTGAVSPSCELVEINDNELLIVNNVDLPGMISAAITDTAGVNEVQTITQCSFQCNVSGGFFTITFDGQTTGAMELPADATTAEVQTALEGLSNIGAGNVSVTGDDFALGPNPGNTMSIEFTGVLGGMDVAQMTVSTAGVTGSGFVFYDAVTVTEGSGGIHTLTADDRVSGGTFTLSFDNGMINSTTVALDFDATVQEIENALNNLASINGGGGVVTVVSTDPNFINPQNTPITKAPVEVNFSGVANADVNVLVVDNTNLE